MKYLKTFKIFESENKFSPKFINARQTHKLIISALDMMDVSYEVTPDNNFDMWSSEEPVSFYQYETKYGELVTYFLFNEPKGSSNSEKPGPYVYVHDNEYDHEELEDIMELIDHMEEKEVIDKSKWIKQLNENNNSLDFTSIKKSHKLISNILKLLNVRSEIYYLRKNFDSKDNDEPLIEYVLHTEDENCEYYCEEDNMSIHLYNYDEGIGVYLNTSNDMESINDGYELIKRLKDYSLIDSGKYVKQLHERRTEKEILQDPKTDYKEKQVELNDLNKHKVEEYRLKKFQLQELFENLENEIDPPTVSKIIGENQYLKQYVMLLSELRNKNILKTQIETIENEIEELKKSLIGTEGDSRRDISTKIKMKEEELKNESDKTDSIEIEKDIERFEKRMIDLKKDLDNGISALKSNLYDLKIK